MVVEWCALLMIVTRPAGRSGASKGPWSARARRRAPAAIGKSQRGEDRVYDSEAIVVGGIPLPVCASGAIIDDSPRDFHS
jgi:hypothetical protein